MLSTYISLKIHYDILILVCSGGIRTHSILLNGNVMLFSFLYNKQFKKCSLSTYKSYIIKTFIIQKGQNVKHTKNIYLIPLLCPNLGIDSKTIYIYIDRLLQYRLMSSIKRYKVSRFDRKNQVYSKIKG